MKSIKWQTFQLDKVLFLLRKVMVPRGGIQVKEICFCFHIVDYSPPAILSNENTNKIFLWIGSVPEYCSLGDAT
ncbi:hypothetical protein B5V02_12805 [Mesorhizobium kowhaii]|uniref:Uncharacterized protein n=1 Tax=Mesorhizobium kowhaii TaxID=1300272 RepID=A0A2W7E1P0_9HYPH|nr:hypothetical protein B5V02_12805 [Mesorhizobium kowhaii]